MIRDFIQAYHSHSSSQSYPTWNALWCGSSLFVLAILLIFLLPAFLRIDGWMGRDPN